MIDAMREIALFTLWFFLFCLSVILTANIIYAFVKTLIKDTKMNAKKELMLDMLETMVDEKLNKKVNEEDTDKISEN